MQRYLQHLCEGADRRTKSFLQAQVLDPNSLQYGGIRGDIWEAKPTIYALATALAAYLNPGCSHFESRELLRAMKLAAAFVERTQRDDGSFDYPSCNFHSAPDTSFCFKRLIAGYRLMTGAGAARPELEELRDCFRRILRRALPAIRDGGFHTPNHRWAIAAALLQGANLFAQEEAFAESLRARAGQYLAEGIDCDEDGEYAERSAGNYNAVVNNAMLALWQETGNDFYLDCVRRNLTMMLDYIDPDGYVFTQNSTRQDLGRKDRPDLYFYQYLAVCSHEPNEAFDAAAHEIIRSNRARGDLAPDCLHILMNHPEMMSHVFSGCGFPSEYHRFFPHSGVLRVARPAYSYTVLRGKSDFLYVKRGALMLCVRLGESLCETRNFVPAQMEVQGDVCTLSGEAQGWYYQPFDEPPATSDWWEMDQSARKKKIACALHTQVRIVEREDGLDLELEAKGLDRLPLRLELWLPQGVKLSHEAFAVTPPAGAELLLRAGELEIRRGADVLRVGPGFGEHAFGGHYSGEERNLQGVTVYCNAYTPAERSFSIRVGT